LLLANPERINWTFLSENPAAIELLKAHPSRVNIICLCCNIAAMDLIYHHLISSNQDKINYMGLSRNPSIFTNNKKEIYDYLLLV